MPPYAVRVRTATGWQDIALQGKSVAVYEQPNEPTGAVNGDIWIDTDAPTPAPLVTRTMRTGQSYVIGSTLTAGQVIPSIFVPILSASQTTKIIGARHKIVSGTSIVAQLQRNGSNIGTAMTITPTKATTTFTEVVLADGDEIGLVLSSPVGTPMHLSLTVMFEHTV